jgi:hypothetical protein
MQPSRYPGMEPSLHIVVDPSTAPGKSVSDMPCIAHVNGCNAEAAGNAQLLAAAEEMRLALIGLLKANAHHTDYPEYEYAVRALAKAGVEL